MVTKLLFVEPPKDYWFLMGEYLPPPTGLLILAAYIEERMPGLEIEILDCQAQRLDFKDLEKQIESHSPSIIATSGFSCNVYVCARVAEIAKKINSDIVTIVGGQHFSSTAQESLLDFPEIDYIIRGEGEETFFELIKTIINKKKCFGSEGSVLQALKNLNQPVSRFPQSFQIFSVYLV